MEIKIEVTEPQAQFMALDCPYPLFVGGYGSGKSETLINRAILDALESPDALIAIYAPTYRLLKLTLIPRLLNKLDNYGIKYDYNKADHIVYPLHSQMGKFVFRSLDNPEQIVGYESFRAHIDELDILPVTQAETAWNKIIGRNRQRPKGAEVCKNRTSAYCTPEGYKFLYQRWVKNEKEAKRKGYDYVTAPSYTNHFIEDSNYVQQLRDTYPSHLVEAYIEGKFVNMTTGTVYNNYNRQKHESNEEIKPGEPLYIGCDFNVTRQAATIYVRRNGGTEWHAVDELTKMYDTPSMIETINLRYPGHRIIIYPDASGIARKTINANISDIALLEQAGYLIRMRRKNPSVKDRVICTNAALAHNRLFINSAKCPTVAECLEQQTYDHNGLPDKSSGNDHQNDATTYPIVYEMPIRKPVAQMAIKF